MLELDGVRVPGYNLRVSGNLQIASEDASGETSGTDDIDKGFKAKRFTVSLSIRFDDEKELKQIVQLAEKKNKKEERHVYTITNQTANIAGVRKVRFSENLSWAENDGLQAWDVSCELKEVLSTSERKEQREKKPVVTAQKVTGQDVGEATNLLQLISTVEDSDLDNDIDDAGAFDEWDAIVGTDSDEESSSFGSVADGVSSAYDQTTALYSDVTGQISEVKKQALAQIPSGFITNGSIAFSQLDKLPFDSAVLKNAINAGAIRKETVLSPLLLEIKKHGVSGNVSEFKNAITRSHAIIQNLGL